MLGRTLRNGCPRRRHFLAIFGTNSPNGHQKLVSIYAWQSRTVGSLLSCRVRIASGVETTTSRASAAATWIVIKAATK